MLTVSCSPEQHWQLLLLLFRDQSCVQSCILWAAEKHPNHTKTPTTLVYACQGPPGGGGQLLLQQAVAAPQKQQQQAARTTLTLTR